MEFFIEAMGVKQLRTQFNRIGVAALDAKPAMEVIAMDMMEVENQTFLGQGRRGGGSWKNLTLDWMIKKSQRQLDPRINIATGALWSAMSEPGAPGQILHIRRDSVTLGSDLPQAGPSQRERPFIKFLPTDKARWRQTIQRHLMAAWRSGRA